MQLGDTLVIGVSVNNVTGISGKSYAVGDLLHAAVEAEAMQFDAIWVHDAPLGRRTLAALDPVTVLAAVAAQTKTLRLGTGILTPQLRNPVSLAQQWATLFALSEGRAIMGVGSGAGTPTLLKREFEALAALRHDFQHSIEHGSTRSAVRCSMNRSRRHPQALGRGQVLLFRYFLPLRRGDARRGAAASDAAGAGGGRDLFSVEARCAGASRLDREACRHLCARTVQTGCRLWRRLDDRPPQAGGIRSALGEIQVIPTRRIAASRLPRLSTASSTSIPTR